MWKLDVFLLPCKNYRSLAYEELLAYDKRIGEIEEHENFMIPKEFYETKDVNQQTIYDAIFGEGQHDLSDYLLELFTKKRGQEIGYTGIRKLNEYAYTAIVSKDIEEDKAHLALFDMEDKTDRASPYQGIIPNDAIKVKRYYLRKCMDFRAFEEKAKCCFPRLIFHPDAFNHIAKLGRCKDVVSELMRHLCALNDYGDKIYSYTGKNEKNALLELQSSFQVYCSGKGSNETMSYNKDIVFQGKTYTLTCNPHTKLFKKYSGQRIYFCWGREEIEGHKIIIVRIGGHWEE